jgi:hypothetical protein
MKRAWIGLIRSFLDADFIGGVALVWQFLDDGPGGWRASSFEISDATVGILFLECPGT